MPFRDIVGHRRLVGLLSRAVARGAVPQALLFEGPDGVGKWLAARALAQVLHCAAPVAGPDGGMDACGACTACGRAARGVHVDLVVLEPDDQGSIRIEAVRDVQDQAAYRPYEGRGRAVLVRDAEALGVPAQNALLKSLEEPPPATVFVLVTAVPGLLLPTVRSRCMRLRFGRLTEQEVAEALVRSTGVTPEAAQAAAALADGSVGRAAAQRSEELAAVRAAAEAFLEQVVKARDVRDRLEASRILVGARPERTRAELAAVLRAAQSLLRDIEVLNTGADPGVLANRDRRQTLTRLARVAAGARARAAFDAIDRALAALDRNAGTKVAAEWVAMRI